MSREQTARRADLGSMAGFLVADAQGLVVGRVEGVMCGGTLQTPEALSVRSSLLRWRRRPVPSDAIETIDEWTRVIGLRIERSEIRASV